MLSASKGRGTHDWGTTPWSEHIARKCAAGGTLLGPDVGAGPPLPEDEPWDLSRDNLGDALKGLGNLASGFGGALGWGLGKVGGIFDGDDEGDDDGDSVPPPPPPRKSGQQPPAQDGGAQHHRLRAGHRCAPRREPPTSLYTHQDLLEAKQGYFDEEFKGAAARSARRHTSAWMVSMWYLRRFWALGKSA